MVLSRHGRPNGPASRWSHLYLQLALFTVVGGFLSSAPRAASAFQTITIDGSSSVYSRSTGTNARSLASGRLFLAAGRGMGMAQPDTVAGSPSNKKKSKKQSSSSSSAKSSSSSSKFTASTGTSAVFNVNAALAQLAKRYEELEKAADTAMALASGDEDSAIVLSEYVVATRAAGYVDDWVPIAQICVSRGKQNAGSDTTTTTSDRDGADVSPSLLSSVVSQYCRELSQVAIAGSPRFQSIPRPLLQYAVEPESSFRKFVYEPVVRGNLEQVEGDIMTRAMAKQVLELEDLSDANGSTSLDDKSRIKSAYRQKSFQYHPDRFIGKDQSAEQAAFNADAYSRVQRSYETLVSGAGGGTNGSSWYASLGGRARTDFRGPIELIPIAKAVESSVQGNIESALVGLEPAVVQEFLARSQQVSNTRKQ
jgi:hypothetical protein